MVFAALRERAVHIADVADHLARLARRFQQFLLVEVGIVARVRAVVPFDLQLLAALKCRPRAVRNHGHAAQRLECVRRFERRNGRGLLHPAHLQRLFVVERLHLAAHHRRPLDRRVKHARPLHIHPENGFAGADIRQVDNLRFLADITPLALRLELQRLRFRNRQFSRGLRQRAVA